MFVAFSVLFTLTILLLSSGRTHSAAEDTDTTLDGAKTHHWKLRKEKPQGTTYQPIRDILYKLTGRNTDRDVFVVPRRAYYDNRIVKNSGFRRNIIAILTEAHDNAVKAILACELDGKLSQSVQVFKEKACWVRRHRPGTTHRLLVVECVGLPREAIFNGSIAQLIYRRKGDAFYSRVQSEKPLILHRLEKPARAAPGSVVVCATMYGHPDVFD